MEHLFLYRFQVAFPIMPRPTKIKSGRPYKPAAPCVEIANIENSKINRISEDMLCKAIKTLKAQSAKDHDGVFSNHLKLAPSSFLITLLAFSTFYLLLV